MALILQNKNHPNPRDNQTEGNYNNSYNNGHQYYTENCSCNRCGQKAHLQKDCTKPKVYCTWCKKDNHDTLVCRTRGRYASTPYESPSAGGYHPTQSPHRGTQHSPVEPHITRPSPTPSGGEEWAKLLVIRLDKTKKIPEK